MPAGLELVDKTFGFLTVLALESRRWRGYRMWKCQCSCGRTTVVHSGGLTSGDYQSCGCRGGRPGGTGHGEARKGKRSPEYVTWYSMIQRCCNSKNSAWKNYGGRGIRVCREWRDSFTAFLDHVGRRPSLKHTIDRTDNDGDYEPGNVQWVTRKRQLRNRRGTHMLTYDDRTMSIPDWAEELGLSARTIYDRVVKLGWLTERALVTPTGRGQGYASNP